MENPLHAAAIHGDVNRCRELLLREDIDVNAKGLVELWFGKFNYTPLMYAAYKGRVDVIHLLLRDSRVHPTAVTDRGFNALHIACLEARKEAVSALVDDGRIDVNAECLCCPFGLTCRNSAPVEMTALAVCAVREGRRACAKVLLSADGIDVNKGTGGWPPIHVAALDLNSEFMSLIMEAPGFDCLVWEPSAYWLACACVRGTPEAIRLLLQLIGPSFSDCQKLIIWQEFDKGSSFMFSDKTAAITRILLSDPRTSLKSYVPSVLFEGCCLRAASPSYGEPGIGFRTNLCNYPHETDMLELFFSHERARISALLTEFQQKRGAQLCDNLVRTKILPLMGPMLVTQAVIDSLKKSEWSNIGKADVLQRLQSFVQKWGNPCDLEFYASEFAQYIKKYGNEEEFPMLDFTTATVSPPEPVEPEAAAASALPAEVKDES